MATHILEIAENLCDRVGIIQGGGMLAQGTVAELRAHAHASDDDTLESVFLGLTGSGEGRVLADHLGEG